MIDTADGAPADGAPADGAPADGAPARSRWSARRLGVLAAVAVGVAALGIGVAAAQTGSTPTSAPVNPPNPGAGPAMPGFGGHRLRGPGGPRVEKFGRFGRFGGPGGAIHGELTVPDGSGGWRTMDMQTGTATAVSPTSITVKSADGFSKTYAVDAQTVVNAGRDGISTIKTGDTVGVRAVAASGSAKALDIQDLTTLKALHDQWGPKRPTPSSTTSTTAA